MENKNVYYLVNFHYGELRVAVGEDELEKIKLSKDGWEVVEKEKYDQLRRMYEAGAVSVRNKIIRSLEG